jgi:hypothetical protein
MTPFVLAVALVLQQQVAPQRPSTQRPSTPSRPTAVAPAPDTSAQTATRQAITDVGRGIAEARSNHELLRRSVFNGSDTQVLEQANAMQQRCREIATIAQSATGRVCRRCFAAAVQRVIDAYRAVLPGVGQVGTRCVNQLAQDLHARGPAAAVRANIHALGRSLTSGLYTYEAKLLEVRKAFGLVVTPVAPARR